MGPGGSLVEGVALLEDGGAPANNKNHSLEFLGFVSICWEGLV